MARQDKELVKLFEQLGERERQTLMDFAEFLVARSEPPIIGEPKNLPRPESETVIGAIKRLSESYNMLDKSKMLHETSTLVSQHLIHGRKADEVIDELEVVFRSHYERLVGENKD